MSFTPFINHEGKIRDAQKPGAVGALLSSRIDRKLSNPFGAPLSAKRSERDTEWTRRAKVVRDNVDTIVDCARADGQSTARLLQLGWGVRGVLDRIANHHLSVGVRTPFFTRPTKKEHLKSPVLEALWIELETEGRSVFIDSTARTCRLSLLKTEEYWLAVKVPENDRSYSVAS